MNNLHSKNMMLISSEDEVERSTGMGVCMKDHPAEDVREKIEEVQDLLNPSLVTGLLRGLEENRWEQPVLNELFHALKKLEKSLDGENIEPIVQDIAKFLL